MRSLEEGLLGPANRLLDKAASEVSLAADRTDARLSVLESVSSLVGGWDLEKFWEVSQRDSVLVRSDPGPWATQLIDLISETPIPVPLALSALSREVLPVSQQRRTGAYYTDWRLAELLAGSSVQMVTTDGPWIDTACGSGVLLTAAAMAVTAGRTRDEVIRERLTGADLSSKALRGALLSVASLTSDLSVIQKFSGRLLLQDSLRSQHVWSDVAPHGAALVIGNPPWEKLKVSRHELSTSRGEYRHYGQSYDTDVDLSHSRTALLSYIEQVVTGTRLQGRGEHDLYKLFLELGMGISAEDGVLALLLPAGLIRAQGTESLRRELVSGSEELSISVIENRARHFAIDTRFKFVAVVARISDGLQQPISLKVANRAGTLPDSPVKLRHSELRAVRSDLSMPEVKTPEDWELFSRLVKRGIRVGDVTGPWHPEYRREIDMTLDRKSFVSASRVGTVPVLEGRHIAQFRWRAKTYQSGEGRAARWRPEPLHAASMQTQWFVPTTSLHRLALERTERSRIGFCDITGQTNERSLIVARVPSGVVCGNKVPTLAFAEGGADREDLFLALTNSLIVDWMMRRLVTTTVNFFLFNSLALPRVSTGSRTGRELISLARRLTAAEADPAAALAQAGRWRARIDALVATAWGLTVDDMEIVLRDFPLLDRGQPPLMGEHRSTVTADSVLAELAKLCDVPHSSAGRLQNAVDRGATPYVPAEFT